MRSEYDKKKTADLQKQRARKVHKEVEQRNAALDVLNSDLFFKTPSV